MLALVDHPPSLPPLPSGGREWLKQNWLALAMLVAWTAGQLLTGGEWVWARQANERQLEAEIRRLEKQISDFSMTYVRDDVFKQVLFRIDERLASIDATLKAQ